MKTFRFTLIILAAIFCTATGIVESVYRPWVYENNIDYVGFADYAPSFGGAITIVFLFTAIFAQNPMKIMDVAAGSAISGPLYEILQPLLNSGVFDWKDLIASCVGGSLAFLVVKLLKFRFMHNKRLNIGPKTRSGSPIRPP